MALQERLEVFTTRAGQKKVYFKGYLYGRQKVLCSKKVLWRCHLKHCVGICCQGCVTTDGDVTHVTSENPPHCHPTNLADDSVARLRADRRNVQVRSVRCDLLQYPKMLYSQYPQVLTLLLFEQPHITTSWLQSLPGSYTNSRPEMDDSHQQHHKEGQLHPRLLAPKLSVLPPSAYISLVRSALEYSAVV